MPIWPFTRRRTKRSRRSAEEDMAAAISSSSGGGGGGGDAGSSTFARAAHRTSKRQKRDNNTASAPVLLAGGVVAYPVAAAAGAGVGAGYGSGRCAPGGGHTNSLPPMLYRKQSTRLGRHRSARVKHEDREREREIKMISSSREGSVRHSNAGSKSRAASRQELAALALFEEDLARFTSPDCETHSFKIGSLRALTPRPHIRQSELQRLSNNSSSAVHRQRTLRERYGYQPFAQGLRIDGLADDMDATALRELMERDQRRRELRQQQQLDSLHRKLQQRAEMQQAEDELNRRSVGSTSAMLKDETPSSSLRSPRSSVRSPRSWLKDPSRDSILVEDYSFTGGRRRPRDSEIGVAIDECPEDINHLSPPGADRSHLSLSSLQPTLNSDTSSRGSRSSWRSLLRNSLRRKGPGRRPGLSDYAVNSRTPFHHQPHPPPSSPPPPIPDRVAGVPLRAMSVVRRGRSVFTEHFNESPSPPPASTRQRAGPSSPRRQQQQQQQQPLAPSLDVSNRSSAVMAEAEADAMVPSSDVRSLATPTPEAVQSRNNSPDVDSVLLTRSLASIDSEASWLSGKMPRRKSSKKSTNPRRISDQSSKYAGGVAEQSTVDLAEEPEAEMQPEQPEQPVYPQPQPQPLEPVPVVEQEIAEEKNRREAPSHLRPLPRRRPSPDEIVAEDSGRLHDGAAKRGLVVQPDERIVSTVVVHEQMPADSAPASPGLGSGDEA